MTTEHASRFAVGQRVRHSRYGLGFVDSDRGDLVTVEFESGDLRRVPKAELQLVDSPEQAILRPEWDPTLEVIARFQANAIRSVNDVWGVFAPSRIDLLPHQLWVCRQVVESSHGRWLIADDVGLGKTIEAGLILMSLFSSNRIRRLLIITPASLVAQWDERLRKQFGINLRVYRPEDDTDRSEFWQRNNQVVVSLQTLREDRAGRHRRLFESPPWDLLIVDEAHHLNAEERGPTLGYKLVQELQERRLVHRMVFFTGTPHRGKHFGFLALLRLLRPDLFHPRRPFEEQLPALRQVMIRNNKQNVTDLRGQRLFQAPRIRQETYTYSRAEAEFYEMLTRFILEGKAYADRLEGSTGRVVGLVLVAMQKLASSSVAAVRRALRNRLATLRGKQSPSGNDVLRRLREAEESGDDDAQSRAEEDLLAAIGRDVRLVDDEEIWLQTLIDAADQVQRETKIARILDIVESEFQNRSVLFFTEYKATQSLLLSALIARFGQDPVAFINGDDRAEEVYINGQPRTLTVPREVAAEHFNTGRVRFLVSTEAGGEGIDLQAHCFTLVHVDLPWNPMRLHQRVGRINRYGQRHRVEVLSLRNPSTVEAVIWDRLNEKIDNIMQSLREVMDEPEDLLELVLGMTSPTLYREVFSEASWVPRESLATWFDQKTATFGGRDVVETVRNLVGSCARFDFQQVSSHLPDVDLPDLEPFFRAMLWLNGRRPRDEHEGLTFRTPDAWQGGVLLPPLYERMGFRRARPGSVAASRMLGVGHPLVTQALEDALSRSVSVAAVAVGLDRPLFLYRIRDAVTGDEHQVRSVVVGVQVANDREPELLRDWQVLKLLNQILRQRGYRRTTASTAGAPASTVMAAEQRARELVARTSASALGLVELRHPEIDWLGALWPLPPGQREAPAEREAGDPDE